MKLPEDLRRRLEITAARSSLSLGAVVEAAVEAYLSTIKVPLHWWHGRIPLRILRSDVTDDAAGERLGITASSVKRLRRILAAYPDLRKLAALNHRRGEKTAEKLRGRGRPDGVRERVSAKLTGRKLSQEHVEHMKAGTKAAGWKNAQRLRGVPKSPEVRAKIAASVKAARKRSQ